VRLVGGELSTSVLASARRTGSGVTNRFDLLSTAANALERGSDVRARALNQPSMPRSERINYAGKTEFAVIIFGVN
jgi:hypothetical protein